MKIKKLYFEQVKLWWYCYKCAFYNTAIITSPKRQVVKCKCHRCHRVTHRRVDLSKIEVGDSGWTMKLGKINKRWERKQQEALLKKLKKQQRKAEKKAKKKKKFVRKSLWED